nr:transducin/WD40 repeat-like superfamily protein [Tanacetum cinerariifolium]
MDLQTTINESKQEKLKHKSSATAGLPVYLVRDDVNEEEEYPSFDSFPRSFEPIYPDIFSKDEPRFDEDEVDSDEGERLFLEQALRWIPEGVPMARNDVDCGPQDQIGRKYYEGPTTTFLDALNSLSSKIATTKCVGAELFERFKLIAKSDRSNAPYNPGGTGLIPGETTREVKLFRRVMVTLINESRVDVSFDPVPLVASPSYSNSIVWSDENLLAVASGHLVTILNPAMPSGPKGLITIPSAKPFPIGVIHPNGAHAFI